MAFCLPKKDRDRIVEAIKSREITPSKLREIGSLGTSSAERREFFAKYIGEENAKEVNLLFEKSLMKKNVDKAINTFTKNLVIPKNTTRKEITEKLIQHVDALGGKVLEDGNITKALEDFTSNLVKSPVTPEELVMIKGYTDNMKEIWDKAKALTKDPKRAKSSEIEDIIRSNPEWKESYFDYKQRLNSYIREDLTGQAISNKALAGATEFVAIQRALMTAVDIGHITRQGGAYIGTREWLEAVGNMRKYAFDKEGLATLERQILSDEYYNVINKYKKRLGLTMLGERLSQQEEAWLSSITKSIPGVSQSEKAYVGFLNELRYKRFVNMIKQDPSILTDEYQLGALADVISAGTGRGRLPGALSDAQAALGMALFSPKWYASRVNIFYDAFTKKGVAGKEARKNLIRSLGFTLGMLRLAKAAGADIETDPRSSDFGKVKFGNFRFDVSMGIAPYITLLSRIAMMSKKSTTTGKITKLNTDEYKGEKVTSVISDFFSNRTSPFTRTIIDLLSGETFEGDKLRVDVWNFDEWNNTEKNAVTGWIISNLAPIGILNAIDTYRTEEEEKRALLTGATFLTEFVGLSSSSYGYTPQTEEWKEYKEEHGTKAFNEKVREFNKELEGALEELMKSEAYKDADQEGKNTLIDNKIKRLRNQVINR